MFTIFSRSINVTVTSQNGVPSFHLHQKLICGGVNYTPKIILFFMFVTLLWLKMSIETLKWKFDSIRTINLRDIDVDLTSVCWKKHIVYNNKTFWKFVCASRLKSDLSITVCSWLSFLKQVSSLMVGAFSCYSMLTTLPYILNKINVIKVVKVIL